MATTREEESATTGLPSAESVLEMIILKEDEIRKRVQQAESDAQRMIEEAKLDAAVIKRDAVTAEVGRELRKKELEKAREEAEKVAARIADQTEETRRMGRERIEEAVKLVIKGVLPQV